MLGITSSFMAQGITLTNRQLYYQLVGRDLIPNAIEVYKRICTFLTDARYGGHLDWESIEDRGRVPKKHAEWKNVKDLVESAVYIYRLPRWAGQSYYVELYCEKEAMGSVLEPIADKYHIYFGTNKGYSSASTMYDLAKRIERQLLSGKKTVVLYLGDHDPSGLDMIRDIRERISEFISNPQGDLENQFFEQQVEADGGSCAGMSEDEWREVFINELSDRFDVVPLALNMQQINQYKLPPNPAKITDPRAASYIQQHGNISWELDALRPQVLRDLAEAGILTYLDIKLYQSVVSKEKTDIKKLVDFGCKLAKGEA
jgi:hypothetical protein